MFIVIVKSVYPESASEEVYEQPALDAILNTQAYKIV